MTELFDTPPQGQPFKSGDLVRVGAGRWANGVVKQVVHSGDVWSFQVETKDSLAWYILAEVRHRDPAREFQASRTP